MDDRTTEPTTDSAVAVERHGSTMTAPPAPDLGEWPPGVAVGDGSLTVEVLERLRVLVVAGIPVGVLIGGVGSRLAMYLLRLTSPDRVRGLTSDDGFEIGRVTLDGTYNLLALGAAVGIVGAGAYRAVAPWLLGPGWFRTATVAAGSGSVVGSMLVHADGIDFTVLEPTWLAIGLFVAVPALFGMTIGGAVERVSVVGSWTTHRRLRWALPVLLVVAFPPVVVLLAVAGAVLVPWVLARRLIGAGGRIPIWVGLAVRAGWLGIAVLGLAELIADITALT